MRGELRDIGALAAERAGDGDAEQPLLAQGLERLGREARVLIDVGGVKCGDFIGDMSGFGDELVAHRVDGC